MMRTILFHAALLLLALSAPADAQGTLRLLASSGAGTIDPQINYTGQYWQLFAVVYDGLVGFRRVAGPGGLELVGDLADAVPAPIEGGLLYNFHLRPGVRFADGSPVRAEPLHEISFDQPLTRVQPPEYNVVA